MRRAEQVRYLILAAQREGNRTLTALLSPISLTPAQSEALRIIVDHGPLTLKEIGDMLVCDSGTNPSRIVDRLADGGLVERSAGESDRRTIRLTATSLGREKADQVREIEERVYAAIDSALDPQAVETLIRALRLLAHGSAAGAALDNRIAAQLTHAGDEPNRSRIGATE